MAFELKQEFTRTPVLTKWVPDSEMIVETDASDYTLAAIISSQTPDGEIHPIAFHSCSFNPAEINCNTHDKELLAIFKAFKHWCQYLLSGKPVGQNSFHNSIWLFASALVN